MPVRSDVGTSPAAGLAREPGFDVREPDIIGPSVAADRRPMAAAIIGAIDQEAANAPGAHFSECDFLAGGIGHCALVGLSRSEMRLPIFKNKTGSVMLRPW
jgi:hypothetical protein